MQQNTNLEAAFKVVRTLLYFNEEQGVWTPRVHNLSTVTVAAIVAGAGDGDYDGTLVEIEERKSRPYD
jgi:hypothetical protein